MICSGMRNPGTVRVSRGGFGLAGLADLLEARGGRLTAGPHGGGWQLDAEIPA